MNEQKIFQALNDRIAQIVQELEEVETELQKFMSRKRTYVRTYWLVKITFPKRSKKYRNLYACNLDNAFFFCRPGVKEELTKSQAKRCKDLALKECKKHYANVPHKVSIVKVNVYSLSK